MESSHAFMMTSPADMKETIEKANMTNLAIRPFPVKPLLFAQHIIQLRASFHLTIP